jgi:hypothetical protein
LREAVSVRAVMSPSPIVVARTRLNRR